jgi:hypothetical protein
MVTRVIKTAEDLALLVQYLRARPRPYTVDVVKGAKRSTEQNAAMWSCLTQIARQRPAGASTGRRTPRVVLGRWTASWGQHGGSL